MGSCGKGAYLERSFVRAFGMMVIWPGNVQCDRRQVITDKRGQGQRGESYIQCTTELYTLTTIDRQALSMRDVGQGEEFQCLREVPTVMYRDG